MIGGATMPVLEFKAKMRGMPARILVFRDRIEWSYSTSLGILTRGVLASATDGGAEVGARTGDDETGIIPLPQLSSVTAERVGLHSRVTLRARDGTIDVDMSHSKAGRLQEAVRQLRAPAPPAAR